MHSERSRTMNTRIAVNPQVHFGKPCVAGTRITVQSVLEAVRDGTPFSTIIKDLYPELTVEDIQACLQYAIDVVALEDIHVAASMQRSFLPIRTYIRQPSSS